VDETIRLAERLKIEGTPTMILPDGRMVSGSMEAGALLALLK
jgi:protein-disulfide isomerase